MREWKYQWASSFRAGQEAIAVGISNCLTSDDRIFELTVHILIYCL